MWQAGVRIDVDRRRIAHSSLSGMFSNESGTKLPSHSQLVNEFANVVALRARNTRPSAVDGVSMLARRMNASKNRPDIRPQPTDQWATNHSRDNREESIYGLLTITLSPGF